MIYTRVASSAEGSKAIMTNSSIDDECKPGTVRQEKFDTPAPPYVDVEISDDIEEKKLVRRIDWRLLPILGALYSISLVT